MVMKRNAENISVLSVNFLVCHAVFPNEIIFSVGQVKGILSAKFRRSIGKIRKSEENEEKTREPLLKVFTRIC